MDNLQLTMCAMNNGQDQKPTTNNYQPTTNNQQPITNNNYRCVIITISF